MDKDFASIAAHQLRTPLGSMRWNTELLLQRVKELNLPFDVVELIKNNYQSNLQIIDMVDDLLEASRIGQNKISSNSKSFSLKDVIDEIIEEQIFEARSKSVLINFRVNKDHKYFLKIDSSLLKQALSNVISNSVKYAFQNTEVSISLSKKNNFYEIKISNVGIGIPSQDNDLVFNKFYRAKNAIESSSQGFGLGLYISKSFIEKMDGDISFSSSEDKRTIFIIRIPVSNATR